MLPTIMNAQELEILIKDLSALPKECEWVEFKVDNTNSQDIGEYISALSNSACYHKKDFAWLVYGIEDITHKLVGTDFHPLMEKKGNQELENWLVTQLNPRIDVNIYETDFNGLHFAVFKIQATRNTPVSFRGEYYIRVGSYKKRLDDHPAFFDLLKLPLPDNRKGIIERLLQEKVIVKTQKAYQIKNLGAILFAKDLNIFEDVSRKAIRVIFYKGNNRIHATKEQVGFKGYAVGFEGLIKYLDEQLPSNEIIDKALRKRVSLYPLLAIRELVANALIHQDFSIKGSSPMLEVFSNRIEITNPGKPLIDPLRFVDHNPESRNEILARFMRRVNICEERGSGIDKVVFECEYNQLPAPEIIVGDNYTRIILYSHKTLRQMDKQDKVRACYLHACLKYVSGEYMTNQSLRERFGIQEQNYPIASRIISDTIKAGLIKDYDSESKSRKYAKYVPYWF